MIGLETMHDPIDDREGVKDTNAYACGVAAKLAGAPVSSAPFHQWLTPRLFAAFVLGWHDTPDVAPEPAAPAPPQEAPKPEGRRLTERITRRPAGVEIKRDL